MSIDRDDLLQRTLARVIRACDVVFAVTSTGLVVLSAWLFIVGHVHAQTVVALLLIPIVNLGWSVLSRRSGRVIRDLVRYALLLPVTTFLYVSEKDGLLHELWIPALLVCVSGSLTIGIATRRSAAGYMISFVYAAAILIASIGFGSLDVPTLDDALGIVLTGCIISLIASRLGRFLDEAMRQRDSATMQKLRAEAMLNQLTLRTTELSTAIESLHTEMERRIHVEKELHHAQKLESLGRLAAGIAHEINTPVQFVSDSITFVREAVSDLLGLVDKLGIAQDSLHEVPNAAAVDAAEAKDAADLPYLTANVPRALDRAIEGLTRVTTIVRSMKEFSHPDTEDLIATDLNRAIETTLTVARSEYKYVADVHTDFGEVPYIYCHLGAFNQAVLNIVVNAAHAIGDVVADSNRRGSIRIRTRKDGDHALIAISDTGPGIPETIRSLIFDPFFTTKGVGRGTGQGLAIAHSVIVDKHHGKLTFETEVGKGTTFIIQLPIDGRHQSWSRVVDLRATTKLD